ncbi:YdhR family protein [Alteromonadaceae bacterium BrNp21-10]|nr:YdhR family protein [Alteromonadaceae bacterium BrNp21-10]
MNTQGNKPKVTTSKRYDRRCVLKLGTTAMVFVAVTSIFTSLNVSANNTPTLKENSMKPKAYVYTELQMSIPFKDVPWQQIDGTIKEQPGFMNKTWLSGVGNQSGGGLYAFDSIENAQKFVTGYFPEEARGFGVAQTTKIFDADATEEASRDMNSMHYDGKMNGKPGAFVYTEVQVHAVPFNTAAPWRTLNPTLKQQPGIMSKTWLSGLHTGTPGGFYAFDTIENAQKFVVDYFPTEAAALNAAYTTSVFDANATEAASRDMNSPFYD